MWATISALPAGMLAGGGMAAGALGDRVEAASRPLRVSANAGGPASRAGDQYSDNSRSVPGGGTRINAGSSPAISQPSPRHVSIESLAPTDAPANVSRGAGGVEARSAGKSSPTPALSPWAGGGTDSR